MRRKELGPALRGARAIAVALIAALSLTACQTSPPPEEPATATRAEVTLALYKQLQYVLERHESLDEHGTDAARIEQDHLVRLAAEIAVRIVRVDPGADIDGLIVQMGHYQ